MRLKTGRGPYSLFPLFVPLQCGGAACLLGLRLQEFGRRFLLLEDVQLVVKSLLFILELLLLILMELLQAVKLFMQLNMRNTRSAVKRLAQ